MNKKPKRRYEKPFDVDVEILKKRRKADELKKQAASLEQEIKEYEKIMLTDNANVRWLGEQITFCRKKLGKVNGSINGIYNTQIPALTQTRAVLQTDTFPFMPDKSTTLAK